MKLRRLKISRDGPGRFVELAQLEREAFSDHRLSPSQQSAQRFLRMRKHVVLVAEHDGVAIGYLVVMLGSPAHVYALAVSAAHRGRGIGSALLAAAEGYARRCAEAITLECRESNLGSARLYRRHGYHECGRLAGYYGDGSDALCFSKSLVSDNLRAAA